MSLINITNLGLAFSRKTIFSNLNIQVEPGDRIGLVGPNGSGKTSLLKIISSEMSPDEGEVRIKSGCRVGFLPQDAGERMSGEILQSVIDSIPNRTRMAAEILEIENTLSKHHANEDDQHRMAARLAELHHDINILEKQYPSHGAEKILEGLGFKTADLKRPVTSLSGGWKIRVALASILYQNSDVLLLDEPTNHLDMPSVHWLEQFLADYKGAIILVCHDREFLNHQIKRVISFETEGVRSYTGNYDQYMGAREEEIKGLEARARNQESQVKEAKRFIERFRTKATKARQAQSKIKLLKKIEMVETHKKARTMRFSFPDAPPSGRIVLSFQNLSKSFGENVLYKNIDLSVLKGEKVAVLGPNGYGKTTLLRMASGEIKPTGGSVSLGHNVEMSYYAQHHSEMLDPNKTVLEEVYQVVPHESVSFVRGICGAFLFSGDDVDKPVRVLSGGEKARVCLAKMLIKPGNFILMDEPTNHLDLMSSEILIEALSEFNGTLLFVSHNQSFIHRLATKVWDINDGNIIEYPGSLEEYYLHLESARAENEEPVPSRNQGRREEKYVETVETKDTKKGIRKEKAEKRTFIRSKLKPFEDKVAHLEGRISDLEKREKEIGLLLSDPAIYHDKTKSVSLLDEYRHIKDELEESIMQWEESQNDLETTRSELGIDAEEP
jgi:ATP-binding cassette, subfamily F, member 3